MWCFLSHHLFLNGSLRLWEGPLLSTGNVLDIGKPGELAPLAGGEGGGGVLTPNHCIAPDQGTTGFAYFSLVS
jgi:hypothetical protein